VRRIVSGDEKGDEGSGFERCWKGDFKSWEAGDKLRGCAES